MDLGVGVLARYHSYHSHSVVGSLIGLVVVLAIVGVVFLVKRRASAGRRGPYGGPPPGGYPPPTGPTTWGNPHASYPQAAAPPAGQDVYDNLRAKPYGTPASGAGSSAAAAPPAPPTGQPAQPTPPRNQAPPRDQAPSGPMPPGWGGQASRD